MGNINYEIAIEILTSLPDAQKAALRDALYKNFFLISEYAFKTATLTIYKEGYYLELHGEKSKFNIYARDNDGNLIIQRKPPENKLHKIYTDQLELSEADFRFLGVNISATLGRRINQMYGEEKNVTQDLKPLLNHKKIVRKITKYFNKDFDQEMHLIYLKRGNVSRYEDHEVDVTECRCTGDTETDAKYIDGWLDEILYTTEGLKKVIEEGYKIEFLYD